MNHWKLIELTPLSGASIDSDNSGLLPKEPKMLKTFLNEVTGEISRSTDLISKKRKRNTQIDLFRNFYLRLFKRKKVSLFGAVVNNEDDKSISDFISFIKKKLKRKGIDVLGYVWVRDVGDIIFEKHFHVLIAITRITNKQFNDLFKSKTTQKYEVEFVRNIKGLTKYCRKKELYGKYRQRSYGKSQVFKKGINT